MNQDEIRAAYSKLARAVSWPAVVNVKVFDSQQTSIIRVFLNKSEIRSWAVFASYSADGKTSKMALETVLDGVADSIKRVGAEVGCVEDAINDALARLH